MPIEEEVKNLTAAVKELTATLNAVSGDRAPLPAILTGESKPTAGSGFKKPAETTKASAETKAATTAAKPAPAAKPAGKAPAKAAEEDPYAPVKKAILDAVAGGHRASINSMLAEYDCTKGDQLPPESYPEVLEKIAAITGGEVEDLA